MSYIYLFLPLAAHIEITEKVSFGQMIYSDVELNGARGDKLCMSTV